MRTIIIEDDNLMLEAAKVIIGENKYFNIVGSFLDANEALQRLKELSPEIVFLDVEMPSLSGIEVSKKLKEFNSNIQIVFVTAHEKYALDAFKVSAIDYMLKPITKDSVNETVKKLLKFKDGIRFLEKEKNRNKICTLGDFKVYGNNENEIIKWPTAKVEELFARFIVARGNSLDRWYLSELFWPEASPEKALHSLHNSIYRLKQTLKINRIENIVSYEKGCYKIDLNHFECDLWECEDFIMLNLELNDDNIEKFEKINKIYKGSLFRNKDYVWSIDIKEELDKFFLNIGKNISEYFYNKEEYYKSEEVLRKLLKDNPLDEDLTDLAMKNDFKFENKMGIINTFNGLKNYLKKELNVSPRKSTEKLYSYLINNL